MYWVGTFGNPGGRTTTFRGHEEKTIPEAKRQDECSPATPCSHLQFCSSVILPLNHFWIKRGAAVRLRQGHSHDKFIVIMIQDQASKIRSRWTCHDLKHSMQSSLLESSSAAFSRETRFERRQRIIINQRSSLTGTDPTAQTVMGGIQRGQCGTRKPRKTRTGRRTMSSLRFVRVFREIRVRIPDEIPRHSINANDHVQGARGEDYTRSNTASRVLPWNGLFAFAFHCDSAVLLSKR